MTYNFDEYKKHKLTGDHFTDYLLKLINSNLKDWGEVDYYACLSQSQQSIIQALKRMRNRLSKRDDAQDRLSGDINLTTEIVLTLSPDLE